MVPGQRPKSGGRDGANLIRERDGYHFHREAVILYDDAVILDDGGG
jgi:hypothetical protein